MPERSSPSEIEAENLERALQASAKLAKGREW